MFEKVEVVMICTENELYHHTNKDLFISMRYTEIN